MTAQIVVLSFDTELAWGRPEQGGFAHLTKFHSLRSHIDGIVEGLDHYEIPVTWAFVGHLLLRGCDGAHEGNAPSGRWYSNDPGTSWTESPLWYAPDIVEKVLAAQTAHEIGAHSFSHVPFGLVSASVARGELELCRAAFDSWGLKPRSFIFPRQEIGHLQILGEYGYRVFRGGQRIDYGHGLMGKLQKALREVAPWQSAPVVKAKRVRKDLVSIPGSMGIDGWGGLSAIKKRVFQKAKLIRLKKTLEVWSGQRGILHLHAHPHNFSTPSDIAYFSQILSLIDEYRTKDKWECLTLEEAGKRATA